MRHRGYQGPEDVARLQRFNAEAVAARGMAGHLHVGDIPHRLFNGLRFDGVADHLHIWEDADGEIAAWGGIYPRMAAFDLQVAPELRDAEPEAEVALLAYLEAETRQRAVGSHTRIETGGFADDEARIACLDALGWQRGDDLYTLSRRTLDGPAPVELPPGFFVRAVTGIEDVSRLVEVHSGSFGSQWTEELYRNVMESPGYAPERELVVVAPSGEFAAFAVMWFDTLNGTGLFEPVGTHRDFRRLGLGRAILAAGMQRMRRAGLHTAMVMYANANESSGPLYRSVGFEPTWAIYDYSKPIDPNESGTT
jgi:ribosomal protein S18 acetylase RimI-like enzyme